MEKNVITTSRRFEMKPFFYLLVVLSISGCAATLEDFYNMSSDDRTNYICNEHRQIRNLNIQVKHAYKEMSEIESVLSRGYRVHKSTSCEVVSVPVEEICYYIGASPICEQSYENETVCEEIQVAIDRELEKENLRLRRNTYQEYKHQLADETHECKEYVNKLGLEESFRYYQAVK